MVRKAVSAFFIQVSGPERQVACKPALTSQQTKDLEVMLKRDNVPTTHFKLYIIFVLYILFTAGASKLHDTMARRDSEDGTRHTLGLRLHRTPLQSMAARLCGVVRCSHRETLGMAVLENRHSLVKK